MKVTSLTDAYIIKKSSPTRKTNDYYPTPPIATECLLNHYGNIIPKKVWEPAAGRGWISKTLIDNGYDVLSTDLFEYDDPLVKIHTGLDFLHTHKEYPAIITNPPYKNNLAQKFSEKALNEAEFVAMFVRLTFMESVRRYNFFKKYPPNILVFSNRINCIEEKFDTYKGQLGGMMAYAWFVWSDKLPGNTIEWINVERINK